MDNGVIITAIIGAAGTFISFMSGKKSERAKATKIEAEAHKISAEAESIEMGTIERQISIYQNTLNRLEIEIKELTKKVKSQEEKIIALQIENKSLHEELFLLKR